MPDLLKKDKNCWRVEQAKRLSFLIDGAEYFSALYKAMQNARHSIYILSWDINSRLQLLRDDNSNHNYPTVLGELLNALAKKKRDLNIYILNWDFAMIYAPDRELLPIYQLDWKTHPRVHFCLDDYQPSGASQHQKIVIIDDSLAFIGGLDLTLGRWDTSDHLSDNPKRDRIDNKISRPYHDVQVMLEGNAATALAEIARVRWQLATGNTLPPIENYKSLNYLWPNEITVDIENVNVGLARTRSAYKDQDKVREIQHFYQDAIGSAKHYIYIENQYFTAPSVATAIQKSLEQEQGPEIVMVLPRITDGWMSQMTMDVLRVRLIRQLQEHDQNKRLRVYYPDGPGLDDSPVNVHAKLMVVDDSYATVGSANLNNRSMGLDTECNVIIDAQSDEKSRQKIGEFRCRLLAEHLGCTSDEVQEVLNQTNSLISSIEKLTNKDRRFLNTLPIDLPADIDRLVPDTDVADPEEPLEPNLIMKRILPEHQDAPARSRILVWLLLIALITGLAAMWQWTPLSSWVNVESISETFNKIREIPASPLWVVLVFVLAGFVAFPFTILIIATVLAFGLMEGFIYSLIGGILSALIVYFIGEKMARKTVHKLAGSRLNKISEKLSRHGVITIVAVRIVPVAPFTVVNLVAGASHINFRDYTIGTLLGMAPGMFSVTLIADRAYATIKNPGIDNLIWLVLSVAVIAVVAYFLINWTIKKAKRS